MRLGFAVKVLGRPELKSHDTRRWQSGPHLSVSLRYLRDILAYLEETGIRMYRLSSNLAPYLTHPDLPQFHHQLEDCEDELAEAGRLARALDVRLSLHPGQYTVLNSTDEDVARRAIDDVVAQSRILDLMQQGPEAVVVVHAGSGAGGMEEATARFVRRFHQLPPKARRRLAVENDESVFSVPDVLRIHQATGLPVVLDLLHFNNNNPDRRSPAEALRAALDTWPPEVPAKIHVSSPRTEMRVAQKKDPATGKKVRAVTPPRWSQHSDYANPFEVIGFLQGALRAGVRPFDVMLELKSKDLGLLQLRQDLERFAPELVGEWF